MTPDPARAAIVDATGRPARQAIDTACPTCHAPKAKRVRSSGYGIWHDVCGVCGHDFDGEQTVHD